MKTFLIIIGVLFSFNIYAQWGKTNTLGGNKTLSEQDQGPKAIKITTKTDSWSTRSSRSVSGYNNYSSTKYYFKKNEEEKWTFVGFSGGKLRKQIEKCPEALKYMRRYKVGRISSIFALTSIISAAGFVILTTDRDEKNERLFNSLRPVFLTYTIATIGIWSIYDRHNKQINKAVNAYNKWLVDNQNNSSHINKLLPENIELVLIPNKDSYKPGIAFNWSL